MSFGYQNYSQKRKILIEKNTEEEQLRKRKNQNENFVVCMSNSSLRQGKLVLYAVHNFLHTINSKSYYHFHSLCYKIPKNFLKNSTSIYIILISSCF